MISMFKSLLRTAVAPLALLSLTVPAHAANPPTGADGAAGGEAALMEMFAKLFDTGDKTPIDPAQLALAQGTAAKLLPDGAYGKMMDQMLGQFIKPILALDSGMSAMQIASKTGVDYDVADKLTEDQRNEVVALLDPDRQARNDGMMNVLKPMLIDMGKTLEGPMRDGIARAYARKFSAGQLSEINAFFATPSGQAYAAESFAIQADPEVLSATFQALPVMMTKFMGSGPDLEAQMKALPQERKVAELDAPALKRLAALLGTTPEALKAYEAPSYDITTATMVGGFDGNEADAAADAAEAAAEMVDAAADAAGEAGNASEPWFNRDNWDPADRAKVEALEAATSDTINAQIEAEEAAIAKVRDAMIAKKN
jgi:Uncharacterized protein conserved in bacteria (DUF2059)